MEARLKISVFDYRSTRGGVELFLVVASCFRNRDKLRPDEPLGLYAEFTLQWSYVYSALFIQN